MRFSRRRFIQAAGATAGLVSLPSFPQGNPIRVGLVTVKTGPLASGGIDMERALVQYLKERNDTLAGRKIELIVADSGGVPAQARTKIQELVERDKIHVMIGPLDTAAALAADDYIRSAQLLTLSVAAADDMTQRKPNPWFTRGTSTASQCAHPMADYCYKTLGYRRMVLIADDIAYGHEMCAGFQRVFEELGGKVVQKTFPPLTVPDYGTYLAQLNRKAEAIYLGFAGSNGFRYVRQLNEYGLTGKMKIVGGMTALDEAVLRNMGDEALGILTACWYSAEIDNPINKKFAAAFRKEWKYDPGFYAAATYTEAAVLQATLERIKGNIEDKPAFMKAVRSIKVDTCRGPVSFDQYGNVVGNVYVRRVARKEGRLVNEVVYTYPNVSQFWTYDPDQYLKNPPYTRDDPPAKSLESQAAVLCDHDAQQPRVGRAALPARRRVLAHLRPDEDREPDARRAFHARCLSRRERPQGGAEPVVRGARRRACGGALRRPARAFHPEEARRQRPLPGAGDAGVRVHHRRPVPRRLGRRPDPGADAGVPAAAGVHRGARLSGVPAGSSRDRRPCRNFLVLLNGKDPIGRDDPCRGGRS